MSMLSLPFTITLALVLCVFFTAGCEEASLVEPEEDPMAAAEAESAAQETSNQKFTFTDVTLKDDEEIVDENGIIEASSKDHKNDKNDVTACSYFTEDYQESLGYYEENGYDDEDDSLPSSDADAVEQFCIDHFGDRW